MEMTTIQMENVRVLRPFMAYKTGQVIKVTSGLARTLELQKYAVRHQEPQLLFAEAPHPAVERAEAPVAKARRRRNAKG